MDDSGPLLVDTGRGLSIQYQGRWLYSRRDPLAAPRAAVLATPTKPETLYVVPSPCLCHGLRELLESLPDSSAVLCVEADGSLRSIAAQTITEEFPEVALTSPAEAVASYHELEKRVSPTRFRRAIEVRLSGGRVLHEAEYDGMLAAIDADIGVRFRNRLALVRMGRLWTKNIIANIGSMRWDSVRNLESGGRPIVVCGAGPSLDCSIPLLRRYRDGLFVLACDTASGALARACVVPDAIVCLEGQVYNVEDFLPLGGRPIALIADLSSHPSSFRALSGPVTLTLSEYTESAFLSRLAASGLPCIAVPPLGSVGVLAIRIARILGGPILVAGLDFAFNQGKTHCAGSPADLRARRAESRTEKRSSAWASSFRDGCTRRVDGSLTDPALSMYAALAAGELRGLDAWDLRGGFGARLPARLLTPGDIERLIRANAGAKNPAVLGATIDAGTSRERAKAFLTGELRRTEKVSAALRTNTSEEPLRRLLSEADFLYHHFPDPERVATLEPDALKRVAAEAAYWRGRLQAALD